jgi:protein SCO1/2
MNARLAARACGAWALLACVASGLVACSGKKPAPEARVFQLTGEVLAVKPDRTQVTVKHDDVTGFMPAMTMPFTVKDPDQLNGIFVGDLLHANLMVGEDEAWLTDIQKTGTLPPEQRSGPAGEPPTVELKPGMPLPDIELLVQDGRPRHFSSYRGSFVLLTFIYTSCPMPDYCPRMDKYFLQLQRGILMAPPLRDSIRLLSISFDPEVDTPAVLLQHAKQAGAYDAVWRFATGDRKIVEEFGAKVGLTVIREGKAGRQITHNLRTVLVDRDGKLVRTYNGNDWSPEAVLSDLAAAVK